MPANRSMAPGTIIPVIPYPDVGQAAKWLCAAFGFIERVRVADHRVQLSVGDASVIASLGPPLEEVALSAKSAQSIIVRIANVDSHYKKAKAAGAVILHEPQVFPYGEKQYSVEDLAGHVWVFSESVADVEPAEWGGEFV